MIGGSWARPWKAIAMQREHSTSSLSSQRFSSRPDYDRQQEHTADALLLLERLRQAARDGRYPSTAELQAEGKFGLRPVNRLVDLRNGKYGKKYDVERINCGHGTYRWRLHEPARLGYPKPKNQTVLSMTPASEERTDAKLPGSRDWFERGGRKRPGSLTDADAGPLFAGVER